MKNYRTKILEKKTEKQKDIEVVCPLEASLTLEEEAGKLGRIFVPS